VVKKLVETNANAVIIDSRPKRPKYDKGHIPGAISMPDSKFDELKGTLPGDKSIPLVFYCGGYT
jgi:rhodanese-related sulfurtransferase